MAAILEMNPLPAESEPEVEAKPVMRFTYPSGSRPLEGYTIKRGVGRGGFGEVYFAVSDAGKEVALKLIRRNLEVELRGVTHCLNLKHPNLVALYDIRTDEHDDRWVVMEFVSGESLEDQIDRYPDGMPTDVAMFWFEGITSAVAYLHDHGIVHRDLKPANIFLDDSVVKIGDYGLSKFISCSRRSGQTESVGTVHYMAPEIANGRYGREIDAYALGIILYEMLTGRVPFEGESVGEVLMKHLTAEPKLDVLAEPFRSVVQGAMAKDPERRINSAAEMVARLRGAAPSAAAIPAGVIQGAGSVNLHDHQRRAAASAGSPAPASGATPVGRKPGCKGAKGFVAFFHREPEPIWEGVRRGWPALLADLNYANWTVTGRVAVAVFLAIVLTVGAFVWIPVAFALVCAYAAYRVVRGVVRGLTGDGADVRVQTEFRVNSEATPGAKTDVREYAPAWLAEDEGRAAAQQKVQAETVAARTSNRRPWRRRGQATWRQAAYQELASRMWRERSSSMVGSLLSAALVAPVAALLSCLFLFSTPSMPLELCLWMAIVATLGSWAIMLPGQYVEGRMEDHAPLRFINLLLGAAVGIIAWLIADAIFLKLPASNNFEPNPNDTLFAEMLGWRNNEVDSAYHSNGSVMLPPAMFAAYFALLFVVLRWWRLAEWTRPSRVSLWAVGWCAFIGWAATLLAWFPQPVGLMMAALIAFTVQLSSPWLSPSKRRELAQKVA